ncbi:MAG: immunoglobulin-like domain-containing protein [Lachnotalea sp.]
MNNFNSNQKLKNALKECMESEIKEVPKDVELKKQYTPTNQFIKYMNHLIRREKMKEKFKIVYEHRKGIYKLAAGVAFVIICINIGTLLLPNLKQENRTSDNIGTESTSDTADIASTESIEDASKSSSLTASDEVTATSDETAISEIQTVWTAELKGENSVILSLANNTDQALTYTNILKIEKYVDDAWITIYSKDPVENKTLNGNESVKENIKLSDYGIADTGRYKLYRNINDEVVTVELETN